ncbi:MAG: response regulator [Gemmatimonadales bacterium]
MDELHVLLVEDSADDAALLIRELEQGGYRVNSTRVDSAAAVAAALERRPWDVVFSDFTLPGYAGTAALQAVRARGLDVPFIFVSGTIGEDRAVQAMKDGAHDYILKDNLTRLLPAVQRELREARSRRERRRAEDLLAQSDARYRALFDANPFPMWVFNLDTLGILAVNQAAIDQYRYTREEFLAMTITQLRPAEDVTTLVDHLAKPRSPGFHARGLWRHMRKDGRILTVEISSHELPFEGQRTQLVVANDVSERARAEQVQAAVYRIAEAAQNAPGLPELFRSVHEIIGALMPAKNLYIALYDETIDMITFPYHVDEFDATPAPRHPSGGLTEHVLRTGQPLLAKPESQAALDAIGIVQSIGAPSVDWLGVPLKEGERTFGVLAVQTYTAGVRYEQGHQDILQFVSTQVATAIRRKRTEQALRASEEKFAGAFQAHPSPMLIASLAEGRWVEVNESMERLTGFGRAEIVGRKSTDLGLWRTTELRDQLLAELQAGRSFREREVEWVVRSGEIRTGLLSAELLTLSGEPHCLVHFQDITERKQLEVQLRQSQKMEAVGRLAGGIAHDFNNVLTAIFGYVDLLREELPASAASQKDIAEVRKAAERAAGLTRQLLAFSRQQVLEPTVLEPNELIVDFEKMLHRVIGEDVELRLALGKRLGNVRADPSQLHQVIMNLAVNARDAMPTGGSLVIETASADLTEQYAEMHQPVVPGRYVMLAVSDSGTGMTPEVKAKIFEPFFTTKERGKGTGLGLSTVYGIVKQSGGYIWVYSELGRGTTFKIYLPRVDAPAEDVAKPREAGAMAGSETILLAEDDGMLRPLAKGLLERLGYKVLEAENAAAALEAARKHKGKIHLLVADVVMPGASGRELARRLAETHPQTKVLYVSGYTDDAIVHHGMLEPGLNFLQKPFTPAVLARKVRDVLDAK